MHAAWMYIKSSAEKAGLVTVSRETHLAADTTMYLFPSAVTQTITTYSLHRLFKKNSNMGLITLVINYCDATYKAKATESHSV